MSTLEAFVDKVMPTVTPQVGWIEGIHNDAYHQGQGLGSSQVKTYLENPGLFEHQHVKGNQREETKALKLGRLVHMAILEPKTFLANYVVQPDFGDLRSSKNRAAKEEWLNAQVYGTIVCTIEERQMLIDMCDSILAHPTAAELLKAGHAERSGYWVDPKTGLLMKFRPDFYRPDSKICVDLKTARSTKYRIFQRDAFELKYHISAAHYLQGLSSVEASKHDDFVFIACEKTAPYTVEVFIADPSMLERGLKEWRAGVDGVAKSLQTGSFPKTTNPTQRLEPINLSLPAYADWE